MMRWVRHGATVTLGVLLLATGACSPEHDGGAARFAQAMAAPCPMFRDQLLWADRPAVACPVPIASPDPARRPCSVAHYLGHAAEPRTVRRLAYDAEGHVERWSDHDGDEVIEARYITYEHDGPALAVHDFAMRCADPAPRFLFTQTFSRDDAGRLTAWDSGGLRLRLAYTLSPGVFGGEARVLLDGAGSNRWLSLDRHGNVSARGSSGTATADLLTRTRYRDGLPTEVRRAGPSGHYRGATRYARDALGRVRRIDIRAPGRPPQRYVLRYDCDDAPTCAPGRHDARGHTGARSPTALDFDPDLAHFQPRDCSEQLRYGRRLCAPLPAGEGGLRASCCRGRPGEILLAPTSPMARRGVARMVLIDDGGQQLVSDGCRPGAAHAPPQCRFPRSALAQLRGGGHFEARDTEGLMIERGRADLQHLARAAR